MRKAIIKVKSIIFDMDGVITHTMPDHYQAWKHVLRMKQINATRNDIYERECPTSHGKY